MHKIVQSKSGEFQAVHLADMDFVLKPADENGIHQVIKKSFGEWESAWSVFTHVASPEEFMSLISEIESVINSGVENSFSRR